MLHSAIAPMMEHSEKARTKKKPSCSASKARPRSRLASVSTLNTPQNRKHNMERDILRLIAQASRTVQAELEYKTLEQKAQEEINRRRELRAFVSSWKDQTSVDSMEVAQ
jgi:hypothetical protein